MIKQQFYTSILLLGEIVLKLYNDARLRVKHLRKSVREVTILTEYARGERVFILRIAYH
jgi:hypothetical protein